MAVAVGVLALLLAAGSIARTAADQSASGTTSAAREDVRAADGRTARPGLRRPRAGANRLTVTQWRRGQRGFATYYAPHFDGRVTASGARFDNDALVAAHPSLPFGTVLRVVNLDNGRAVRVRVVDRGPARRPRANGVVIDLSRAAAQALDFVDAGRARVRLDVLRSA